MISALTPSQAYLEKLGISPCQDLGALTRELLGELRKQFSVPPSISDDELLEKCKSGSAKLIEEWLEKKVDATDPKSILRFYAETHAYCYELVGLDITAPEARKQQLADFVSTLGNLGKTRGLDFGSGIGSTGIYLLRSGFDCEFADVSATNLEFVRRRLDNRKLKSRTYLLPRDEIPEESYDFVLAMDVLEHVPDPIEKIQELRTYLKPGGILLFNVITSHEDEDPLHIMLDPALIRKRIRGLGFAKIGAIGEFKLYQRTERLGAVNGLWRALDTAFWTARIALKGH